MKRKQRQIYSAEFKMEAVRLVRNGGKPVAHIARDLGVPRQQLYHWVQQAETRKGKRLDVFPGNGKQDAAAAELSRLRRELAQAKEDNEILKKATAFFARNSR